MSIRSFKAALSLRMLRLILPMLLLPAAVNAQEYFAPASGKGPAIILISGVSGTALYRDFGQAIANLGYTAILVSGKDVSNQEGESAENLARVISGVRQDSRVVPGKLAVIGFSLGGGGAVLHATQRSDSVAVVIAYYPAITRLDSVAATAKRVAVPTLIFAGGKDRYNNCCLIESMREFESASKAASASVELVVYPEADHGFNLKISTYREADATDAWNRVQAMLGKYFPAK